MHPHGLQQVLVVVITLAPPTAADNCILESGSGNVLITTGSVCRSVDTTSGTGNYAGTITHQSAVDWSIGDGTAGAGNVALKFNSSMTYTRNSALTSVIKFVSTSGTLQTIDFTNASTVGSITFDGVGGNWAFTTGFTIPTTSTLTLTKGTLHTDGTADNSGLTHSWGFFSSSNSNTRTLNLGNSTITMTAGGNTWNSATESNYTLTAGASSITFTGASAAFSTAKTYNNIVFSGSGNAQLSGVMTIANLTRTGTAIKTDTLYFYTAVTISGTLTINGNSATNRVLVRSSTLGTSRTITAATVSVSNADFQDITGAGAGSWNLSAITGNSGDAGGNSGITFTTAATQYWIGQTGSWSDSTQWSTTSGGAANGRVPLPQDDVNFDANSFNGASQTVTADMPRMGKSINLTGATNSPTWVSSTNIALTIYGSLTLISGMTFAQNENFTFAGRGAFTLTSAGKSFAGDVTFAAVGGTYTLQDAFSVTGSVNTAVTNGTFDTNASGNYSVTANVFRDLTSAATRQINMNASVFTLSSTGSAWNMAGTAGTLTINAGTSTILYSSASATTFVGLGKTYYDFKVSNTGTTTITGANTFNRIYTAGTNIHSIVLPGSTVTTLGSGTGLANGTNVITFTASAGSATISRSSGNVCWDYVNLTNIIATGGATFYAGANSTNGGGNTGWSFTACDTTAPTITSVSSDKADGNYKAGEVIDIDVTFSEAVTSTGNVTVTLETGDTDRTCTFTVSSATTGTCNYTVQAGDTSSDLTVSTISGTIADAFSNAMTNFVPTTNLAANKQIVIDTTAPSAPGTPDMTAGTDSGTSTDNITSDTTPDFTISCESGATVTLYDNVTSVGTGTCASSTVTITSSTLSSGTHATMNAKQTDGALNVSAASSDLSITIDTTAPTITSVSSDKTNGTYAVGEVIDIDVTFSESVTSTGDVTVTLETGTTDRTCTFTVSSATTGTCNYTIVSGDTSSDLEATISGTIADTAGNAMSNFTPTTSLAANKALVIDTAVSGSSGSTRRQTTVSPSPIVVSPPVIPTITATGIADFLVPDFLEGDREIIPTPSIVKPSQEPSLSFDNSWDYLDPSLVQNFIFSPLPSELAIFIQKYPDLGRIFTKLGVTNVADLDKLDGASISLPSIANLKDLPTEVVIAEAGFRNVEVTSTIMLEDTGNVEQKIQTISNASIILTVKPSARVNSIDGYLTFKEGNRKSVVELPLNLQTASIISSLSKTSTNTSDAGDRELLIQTFSYEDLDKDGIYTAEIVTPAVDGTYEIITLINYYDKTLGTKELRLTTVVDPEGYVYYLNSNGDESRVPKVVVSIFNAGTDTLWDAISYNQINPQMTDSSGKYSFLVPEGKYYMTAEKDGYRQYKSDVFEVRSGLGVHFNIELKGSGWLAKVDWKIAFLVSIILLLGSAFAGYAVHEHTIKRKLMRRN